MAWHWNQRKRELWELDHRSWDKHYEGTFDHRYENERRVAALALGTIPPLAYLLVLSNGDNWDKPTGQKNRLKAAERRNAELEKQLDLQGKGMNT